MPGKIQFQTHDVSYGFKNIKIIKEGLKQIFVKEGLELSRLDFILCSDKFLIDLNLKYLNHDTYTDILTFDLSEADSPIEGEIYISLERVKENAKKFGIAVSVELYRVMIHGILHLCGFNDHTEEEIFIMRNKENFYLQKINP